MKTNLFKNLIMLFVVATFSIFQVHAQTYGEGNMGSTGCNATGIGGNCTDTYVGQQTGVSNTGFYNSFFGDHAGFSNTSSTSNVFAGYGAGYNNTGGSNYFHWYGGRLS